MKVMFAVAHLGDKGVSLARRCGHVLLYSMSNVSWVDGCRNVGHAQEQGMQGVMGTLSTLHVKAAAPLNSHLLLASCAHSYITQVTREEVSVTFELPADTWWEGLQGMPFPVRGLLAKLRQQVGPGA